MQSDAPHTKRNRDSSVSVATVEKLIAGAFFCEGGGGSTACQCPTLPGSALPADPCVASVCCGGEGAVNQQLARYRPAIEAAEGGPPHPTPYLPSSPPPRPDSPAKPFINQPVGSRATPDTWHTILAGGPDIVGGGQV